MPPRTPSSGPRARAGADLRRTVSAGHNHDADPIAGGVHPAELSLGSGAVDGIFGLAGEASFGRWFVKADAQYYLHTAGAGGYRFGEGLLLSVRPGAALIKEKAWSLSAQFNAAFE